MISPTKNARLRTLGQEKHRNHRPSFGVYRVLSGQPRVSPSEYYAEDLYSPELAVPYSAPALSAPFPDQLTLRVNYHPGGRHRLTCFRHCTFGVGGYVLFGRNEIDFPVKGELPLLSEPAGRRPRPSRGVSPTGNCGPSSLRPGVPSPPTAGGSASPSPRCFGVVRGFHSSSNWSIRAATASSTGRLRGPLSCRAGSPTCRYLRTVL